MTDDSARNAELDGRIADAIQKNIQEIARAVMDEHDTAYPESKLRSIPHEERRLWVEQNLSFIVGSIRENRTTVWQYSYQPNIMGRFDPRSPAFVEISNCYESMLPMEDCMLPYVVAEFSDDPDKLLCGIRRFRTHIMRFIRENVIKLQVDASRQIAMAIEKAAQYEHDRAFLEMGDFLSDSVVLIKEKLNLVYDAVFEGRTEEALALLTARKLLLSDAAERALMLKREGTFDFSDLTDETAGSTDKGECGGGLASALQARASDALECAAPGAGAAPFGGASAFLSDRGSATSFDAAGSAALPLGVTKRELDVLHGVVAGKTNTEIAESLGLSVGTVRNYTSSLLEKLQAENRTQLAVHAVKANLV